MYMIRLENPKKSLYCYICICMYSYVLCTYIIIFFIYVCIYLLFYLHSYIYFFLFIFHRQISDGDGRQDDTTKGKKKKSKKDDKEEDDVEPVAFLKMFVYSTTKDKLLYALGILCAVATGLTTPANSLIFGNLANVSF